MPCSPADWIWQTEHIEHAKGSLAFLGSGAVFDYCRTAKQKLRNGRSRSLYVYRIQFYLSCPLRRQTLRKSFCLCISLTHFLQRTWSNLFWRYDKILTTYIYLSNLTAADSEPNVCGSSVPIPYIGFASLRFVTKGFSETTRRDLSQSTERLSFEKSRDSKHSLNSASRSISLSSDLGVFAPASHCRPAIRRALRTSGLRPLPRPCFTESHFHRTLRLFVLTDPSLTCCRSTFLWPFYLRRFKSLNPP